jgi:hypothetical protein
VSRANLFAKGISLPIFHSPELHLVMVDTEIYILGNTPVVIWWKDAERGKKKGKSGKEGAEDKRIMKL